jgi:hypothetical protein
MMKISTDREIFEALQSMYAAAFEAAQVASDKNGNRIYVPIDVAEVARRIGNDPHVLFGRLYYHLDAKYRYEQSGGAIVHLFALQVGAARHAINFPYLCALLADFRERHKELTKAFWLSLLALILSLGAIIAQLAV